MFDFVNFVHISLHSGAKALQKWWSVLLNRYSQYRSIIEIFWHFMMLTIIFEAIFNMHEKLHWSQYFRLEYSNFLVPKPKPHWSQISVRWNRIRRGTPVHETRKSRWIIALKSKKMHKKIDSTIFSCYLKVNHAFIEPLFNMITMRYEQCWWGSILLQSHQEHWTTGFDQMMNFLFLTVREKIYKFRLRKYF